MKKRFFGLALVLVLTLALAAPVFAEGEREAVPAYRLTSVEQSDGTYVFAYDQGGWLPTEITNPTGVTLLTAAYDDAGRVISRQNLNGIYTYGYDEDGNLLSYGFQDPLFGDSSNRVYTYDENGNCIREEDTSTREGTTTTSAWEYTYDGGLETSSKVYKNGELYYEVKNTYDDAGVLLRGEYTYSDGTTSTMEYTYDETGNLLRKESFKDGKSSYAYEYTYDEAGNQLSETYYIDGEVNSETTRAYDDEGREIQYDYADTYSSYSEKNVYTPPLTIRLNSDSSLGDSVWWALYDSEDVMIDTEECGSYTGEPQFTYDDNGCVTQIDFDGNSVVFTYEPVV